MVQQAGSEPLTKKACVTATAQSVPWAKMATVPPWVVPNVLPTFLYRGRLAMNWKQTFVYRGRLANFLGNLEGFSNFFWCPKKTGKKMVFFFLVFLLLSSCLSSSFLSFSSSFLSFSSSFLSLVFAIFKLIGNYKAFKKVFWAFHISHFTGRSFGTHPLKLERYRED